MALTQRAGLSELAGEHVRPGPVRVNPQVKVPCLVAGMLAEADRIDDMDLLRHSAVPDGGVFVAGTGDVPNIGNEYSAQIFSPPYLFKGVRPTITSSPSVVQYGSNFQVSTPDASSITSVSLIRPAAITHSFDQSAGGLAVVHHIQRRAERAGSRQRRGRAAGLLQLRPRRRRAGRHRHTSSAIATAACRSSAHTVVTVTTRRLA